MKPHGHVTLTCANHNTIYFCSIHMPEDGQADHGGLKKITIENYTDNSKSAGTPGFLRVKIWQGDDCKAWESDGRF